jgi:putative ABC transport system permease protein
LIYIRQAAQGLGIQNMTFSVPEIDDSKSRATTISAFGDFSTVGFTFIGFGREPRLVKAGVVNGSFFEVMGLRPVLGRLLTPGDDGPEAAGAVVLTHRFWKDVLNSDPAVLGQTIRLGSKAATVVGVLEPSVPYPTETQSPAASSASSPTWMRTTSCKSRR